MATILKRGDSQWQATIRKKGYPTQCKTFTLKREAEDWAKAIESNMRKGVFADRTEAEQTTLYDALSRYGQTVTPDKKGRVRELNRIGFLQTQAFSLRSLASLTANDFAAYRDRRRKSVAANTVRLELALISHVFTIAKKEWGIAVDNPILLIRKPKLPQGRNRRLTAKKEQRLMAAIADHPSPDDSLRIAVLLAIGTGMRLSEIASLTWRQIDFDEQVIALDDTKNDDSRNVPMTEDIEHLLLSRFKSYPTQPKPHQPLLSYPSTNALSAAFRRVRDKARLVNFTFHDLRHETASRLAPHMPAPTLAKVMGWKTIQMAMRYYNPTKAELVTAVRAQRHGVIAR
ncbi:tyrosine-type recombinase/integrase [Chitinibacter sp. S2-10]|uniref:tyrosine-type recombinase/integrase n=1 Tax=Chitinibacter sp. S2-10 TaxID=3373597 RepID=UPI0039774D08